MDSRMDAFRLAGLLACAVAWTGGRARAQSFNVDVGAGAGAFGVPSNVYGAAANSPGFWNAFSAGAAGAVPLSDLAGASTAATLSISGGQGDFLFNNSATTGDDQALLDDCGDLNLLGGGLDSATYTFNGLANGRYRVFVYAWTPDVRSFTTSVAIGGGLPCAQICGGVGWSGAHVERDTYVHEDVPVTGNTLVITVTSSVGWGACNGIQLVNAPIGEGSVLTSFPVNPTSLAPDTVIESNPLAVVTAWSCLWISGDGNGAKLHRYRLNGTTATIQQSFDVSAGGNIDAPNSLMARNVPESGATKRRIIVSDTDASIDISANYNWNSTAGSLGYRGISGSSLKTEAVDNVPVSTTTYRVWSEQSNGDIWKLTLDANDTLTFVLGWTPPPGLDIVDLAYDHRSGVLWALSRTNPCGGVTNLCEFVPLDPDTGAIVGPRFMGDLTLGTPNIGLSCDIAVSPVDPSRLAIVALHETGVDDTVVYYALDSFSASSPTSYCTAGTSSSGCVPQLTTTLNPSIIGLYDTTLTVAPMEGQKTGLIFYGMTGPVAIPWGSGSSSYLCVKAPTQRIAPAQNSGGTPGQCNGVFTLDFLSFVYANAGAMGQPFAIGQTFHAQAWYRDPPAPKTTNLSDGLMLTWEP